MERRRESICWAVGLFYWSHTLSEFSVTFWEVAQPYWSIICFFFGFFDSKWLTGWGGGYKSRPNNLHLLASTAKVKFYGHIVCTFLCSHIYIALISGFHSSDLQAYTPKLTVSHFQMFIASFEKPFSSNFSKVYPFVRSNLSTIFKFPEFINDLTLFA